MRDVDHEHVSPRPEHFGRPLEIVASRANRRGDAEPALGVSRRKRLMLLLDQVLRGNETQQRAVGVDERQLLDLARDHQALGILERNRSDADDQLRARRHPFGHERLGADEPDVALGQDAHEVPRLVDNRQSADAGALHDAGGLAHPAALQQSSADPRWCRAAAA